MSTEKKQNKNKYLEAAEEINELYTASLAEEREAILLEFSRQNVAELLKQTVAKDASMEKLADTINSDKSLDYNAQKDGEKLIIYTQHTIVPYRQARQHLENEQKDSLDS